MHNTQIIGIIVFLVTMFYCLCYVKEMEKNDKEFADKKLDIRWEDLDNTCVDYLNAVSQYPHWRICYVGSLISSLIFFSSAACFHTNLKLDQCIASVVAYFLINLICFIKIIDYFRWHVMCQGDKGWGCMKKK